MPLIESPERTARSTHSRCFRARARVAAVFEQGIHAPAHFQSAAVLPVGGSAPRLEAFGPASARLGAASLGEGDDVSRLVCNLFRSLKAAGRLFQSLGFCRALQPAKQSRCGFSKGFHFSNLSASVRGLVAIADGHSSSERKIGNVRKAVGEIRNVER